MAKRRKNPAYTGPDVRIGESASGVDAPDAGPGTPHPLSPDMARAVASLAGGVMISSSNMEIVDELRKTNKLLRQMLEFMETTRLMVR
jgi:hypothetical protein